MDTMTVGHNSKEEIVLHTNRRRRVFYPQLLFAPNAQIFMENSNANENMKNKKERKKRFHPPPGPGSSCVTRYSSPGGGGAMSTTGEGQECKTSVQRST